MSREEKVAVLRQQCRILEKSADMLVSDGYNVELVLKITKV